jgi:hypothetical protein
LPAGLGSFTLVTGLLRVLVYASFFQNMENKCQTTSLLECINLKDQLHLIPFFPFLFFFFFWGEKQSFGVNNPKLPLIVQIA